MQEELHLKKLIDDGYAPKWVINIECNKRGGYYYYIENAEDIEKVVLGIGY